MKFLVSIIIALTFIDSDAAEPAIEKTVKAGATTGALRIAFMAYDVDPRDPRDPAKMAFQITSIGERRRSEFLKLGDRVSQTKLKVAGFEAKDGNPDVSELKLVNVETGASIVLILGKVVDTSAAAK